MCGEDRAREALDADLAGGGLDDLPDGPWAEALPYHACLW